MEAEAEKLKVLQSEVEKQMSMGESKFRTCSISLTRFIVPSGQPQFPTLEEKVDADNRSIYVGQVIRDTITFFIFRTCSKTCLGRLFRHCRGA